MKSDKKYILEFFKKEFPIHYDMIGENNLNDIIEGEVGFESSEGGSNSIVFEVITAAGTIVGMIKIIYDISVDKLMQGKIKKISDRQQIIEDVLHDNLTLNEDSNLLDRVKIRNALEKFFKHRVDEELE